MFIYLKILWLKFIGDWYKVAKRNPDSWKSVITFGVFHPTRYHSWDYPFYSREMAQRECDKLNKEILNKGKKLT